jgi:hypothetical protein
MSFHSHFSYQLVHSFSSTSICVNSIVTPFSFFILGLVVETMGFVLSRSFIVESQRPRLVVGGSLFDRRVERELGVFCGSCLTDRSASVTGLWMSEAEVSEKPSLSHKPSPSTHLLYYSPIITPFSVDFVTNLPHPFPRCFALGYLPFSTTH